jgi:hypothetical protein
MRPPRLLAAALAVCALAVVGVPAAAAPERPFLRALYIVNESSVLSDAEIADALPAFQAAVSFDFKRYWGTEAQLVLGPPPTDGSWVITIEDRSDVLGALGYHDAEPPYARVFAQTSLEDGFSWQVVFTHELFELLADPHINRASFDQGVFRLTEVGDPVESPRYAYTRPSASGVPVLISDFVTEAWYRRGAPGRFDFNLKLRRSLTLLPGGYVSYWNGLGWSQIFRDGSKRRTQGTHRFFMAP